MKIVHDKKRFLEVVAGPGGGLSLLEFFFVTRFPDWLFQLAHFPQGDPATSHMHSSR